MCELFFMAFSCTITEVAGAWHSWISWEHRKVKIYFLQQCKNLYSTWGKSIKNNKILIALQSISCGLFFLNFPVFARKYIFVIRILNVIEDY